MLVAQAGVPAPHPRHPDFLCTGRSAYATPVASGSPIRQNRAAVELSAEARAPPPFGSGQGRCVPDLFMAVFANVETMNQSARPFRILRAGREHVGSLVPLFEAYRRFYHVAEDRSRAEAYLTERLTRGESVVFIALAEGAGAPEALGFTQLYPSFASLSLKPVWILYDLYVRPQSRRQGVAKALMEEARKLAVETGAETIVLETAIDNSSAQQLYEQLGYKRDLAFYRYSLKV